MTNLFETVMPFALAQASSWMFAAVTPKDWLIYRVKQQGNFIESDVEEILGAKFVVKALLRYDDNIATVVSGAVIPADDHAVGVYRLGANHINSIAIERVRQAFLDWAADNPATINAMQHNMIEHFSKAFPGGESPNVYS